MKEIQKLTDGERETLAWVKATIKRSEQAFWDLVKALRVCRDQRLYRETHRTFEEWVKDELGQTAGRAHQRLRALEVREALESVTVTLPDTDAQAQPLATLRQDPDKLREAWAEVVREHGPRPTRKQVTAVVSRYRPGNGHQALKEPATHRTPSVVPEGPYHSIPMQDTLESVTVTLPEAPLRRSSDKLRAEVVQEHGPRFTTDQIKEEVVVQPAKLDPLYHASNPLASHPWEDLQAAQAAWDRIFLDRGVGRLPEVAMQWAEDARVEARRATAYAMMAGAAFRLAVISAEDRPARDGEEEELLAIRQKGEAMLQAEPDLHGTDQEDQPAEPMEFLAEAPDAVQPRQPVVEAAKCEAIQVKGWPGEPEAPVEVPVTTPATYSNDLLDKPGNPTPEPYGVKAPATYQDDFGREWHRVADDYWRLRESRIAVWRTPKGRWSLGRVADGHPMAPGSPAQTLRSNYSNKALAIAAWVEAKRSKKSVEEEPEVAPVAAQSAEPETEQAGLAQPPTKSESVPVEPAADQARPDHVEPVTVVEPEPVTDFPAHWDPKLRIPRGQVVAAASIVSPKY